MALYKSVLKIDNDDAWDVFMVYRRGVSWNATSPPEPDFWMHQLSSAPAPHLDPEEFAKQVNALLVKP